jgi:hypothetical protein
MKNTILVGIIAGLALALIVIWSGGCSSNGIIGLDNYEHGVALCESKYSAVVHPNKAHVWNDGTATFVINEGHYHDPEVKELVKLAHKECAKFSN